MNADEYLGKFLSRTGAPDFAPGRAGLAHYWVTAGTAELGRRLLSCLGDTPPCAG